MLDPKAERIVDAVKTTLEEMTGAYAPERVVRAPAFHEGILDSTLKTVYSLSPGEMEETRHAFGTINNVGVNLPIGLALCQKFGGVEDNPVSSFPKQRWDEQLELLRVAGETIRADRQLGGLALDLVVEAIDVSAENTYIEGWAVAFMLINVFYLHSETSA